MIRALIDIGSLDLRMQEQVERYGILRDFQLSVWRQEPDSTGCNWDTRIERIAGNVEDHGWWNVVPGLRAQYNLN